MLSKLDLGTSRRHIEGYIFLVLFIATVWFANFLILNVGTQFDPNGAHMIPVWFNNLVWAPSGVLAVGIGFTLRDLVQRRLGPGWTVIGIIVGASLSMILSPALALASGLAFILSEGLDFFVYTPLSKKNLYLAVIGSNVVGLIVDSAVFLGLAFGSLDYLLGQCLGKAWMTILFLPVIAWIRAYDIKRHIEVKG